MGTITEVRMDGASDRVRQQNERQVTFEELPGERLLLGSPFEHLHLLLILRRTTSVKPSREVSDIERLPGTGDIEGDEGTEEDSSEMIDRLQRDETKQSLRSMREW
jgi:hypothetical protein